MAKLKTAAQLASDSPLKSAVELALEGRPLTRGQQELLQKNREKVKKLLSGAPEDFVSAVEMRASGKSPIDAATNSRAKTRTYNKMMDLLDSGEWDKMTDAERKAWTDKTFKEETDKLSRETKSKSSAKADPKATTEEPAKKEPAKKKAAKPKPKPNAGVKETFAEASRQSEKKAQEFVDRTTKKAKDKAEKLAQQVTREAREAAVDVAEVTGKAKGVGKVANRVLGTVGKPVSIALAAKDAYDLFDEDEAKKVQAEFEAMGDNNSVASQFFQGAAGGLFDPVNTFVGGARALQDLSGADERAEEEAQAIYDRMQDSEAAETARSRGKLREDAIGSLGLTKEQEQDFVREAKRSGDFRSYSDIQSPEQAKALYSKVYGSDDEEPTIDQDVERVTEELPSAVSAPAPTAEEPKKAKAPTVEELREAADPDTKMMFGTEETPAEPEVDYTDQAIGLFGTTHNTEFDPKSKMDREKLEKMKTLLSEKGGLKNMDKGEQTKFALDFYRRFPES